MGVKTPVVGMLLVGTGLKPDGVFPKTGMVAVGVKEKIGGREAITNINNIVYSTERGGGGGGGGVRKEIEPEGLKKGKHCLQYKKRQRG